MRKLKVGNGRYIQGMLTMAFIANGWKYIPCDALRSTVGKPDWFTFILSMVLSVITYILFDLFTKRESTKVNGTEVDLNGVNINTTSIGEDKIRVDIGVPKGTATEDTIKIIDAIKAISNKDVSEVEMEEKKE